MAFEDPVVRAEREFEELKKLRDEALGVTQEADTGDNTDQPKPDAQEQSPVEEPSVQPEEQKPDAKIDFEARYNSLQGKYNAEIPRLRADRTRLTEENLSLKSQLDELRQLAAERHSSPEPKASNVEEALDNLAEEYGVEFSDALDKRIARIVDARTKGAGKEPSPAPATQQQSSNPFLDQLTELAPHWPKLNTDPGFNDWIESNYDPLTGMSFKERLTQHVHSGDFVSVARLFNAYQIPPAASPAQQIESTPASASQQPSQESLIVPGKRGSGAQVATDNAKGRVWTKAEIDAFYRKAERGQISEDEYTKTQADIWQANRERRIVG